MKMQTAPRTLSSMVRNVSEVQKEGVGAALYAGSKGFMAGLKEQAREAFQKAF